MKLGWLFGWFRDFSILGKITASFFIVILSLGAIAFYVDQSIIDANQRELGYALNARSLRNDANTMRIAMLTLQLMNTDDQDKVAEQMKEISDSTKQDREFIAKLQKHWEEDKDQEALDKLNELSKVTDEYCDTRDKEQMPLLLAHDIEKVKQTSMTIQSERFMKMRKLAADLAKHAQGVADKRSERARVTFYAVLAGLLVVCGGLSIVLKSMIATPIARLQKAFERMAYGDLDVSIEVSDAKDEVGALTRSFDMMLRSWQQMSNAARSVSAGDLTVSMQKRGEKDVFAEAFNSLVQNVGLITSRFREAVTVVGTASEEILVSVKESAAGATQTATAATQTTAIVEEVRQTSHVASQKAKQVSEGAQKTAQITAVGRKATEEIIEGMNRIREQVDLIAEAMVRLSEKSQSISSIISTVDDLAKQSNLLAVNASIEAARAGDLGKGFGVVAQEVKSMAEQSKQSTAQVRSIIAEIQQATNAAAMATELGGKAVDAAMQQSGQAGESIAVLANSVVESAQAAAQIAVSNQQQLAGVDQVATAMASIRDACGEHLVAIRHVESAANRLTEIGGKLKGLVERYEVWETAADQDSMGDSTEHAALRPQR